MVDTFYCLKIVWACQNFDANLATKSSYQQVKLALKVSVSQRIVIIFNVI